jgi:hypothetical protein
MFNNSNILQNLGFFGFFPAFCWLGKIEFIPVIKFSSLLKEKVEMLLGNERENMLQLCIFSIFVSCNPLYNHMTLSLSLLQLTLHNTRSASTDSTNHR